MTVHRVIVDHVDIFTDHANYDAHIAFSSPSREAVDAFYEKALSAGGRPNLPPALHPEFHPQ